MLEVLHPAKSDLRRDVLRVARALFLENGFDAVGMRDIARALGLQPTQVYRLELSKTDILAEIIIALNQEQIDALPDLLASVTGSNAFERTCAYLRGLYRADIQMLPVRSVGAAHGWMWSGRYEEIIVGQVWQLLAPIAHWMNEDGLNNTAARGYGIWSVYYVGFRGAVVHGADADACLAEIRPTLQLLMQS